MAFVDREASESMAGSSVGEVRAYLNSVVSDRIGEVEARLGDRLRMLNRSFDSLRRRVRVLEQEVRQRPEPERERDHYNLHQAAAARLIEAANDLLLLYPVRHLGQNHLLVELRSLMERLRNAYGVEVVPLEWETDEAPTTQVDSVSAPSPDRPARRIRPNRASIGPVQPAQTSEHHYPQGFAAADHDPPVEPYPPGTAAEVMEQLDRAREGMLTGLLRPRPGESHQEFVDRHQPYPGGPFDYSGPSEDYPSNDDCF